VLQKIDIFDIINIAQKAGDAIVEVYSHDFSVEYKADKSPLTEADKKANDIIIDGLNSLPVIFPILSEEGKTIAYEIRKEWEYFWMVDPLDGTKEFIQKNGEFTVNIALIHQSIPVLGVVYAPVINEMYWAKKGYGAYKNGKKLLRESNHDRKKTLRIVASKSHLTAETQEYINQLSISVESVEYISKGSSLKLCMVADGRADIYPRLAPTMEWDTAAADAIVREVNKKTIDFQSGNLLIYNKENLLNPWFVVK
jgi:3'(2'), 5'-bisphosphate nucleotidase